MVKFKVVNKDNVDVDIKLQGTIFYIDKCPKSCLESVKQKDSIGFIAYDGETPVGITGLYKLPHLKKHALLNWFGVLPEYRNRGYGSEILAFTIKTAKKLGFEYLTLYTHLLYNVEAVKLYKKMGFVVKNYEYKEDVDKLKALGEENDYLICVLPLKNNLEKLNFDEINLKISDEFKNWERTDEKIKED